MSVFGSQLWLNIQIHKSSKQIEDKHQSKPESHYRSWVMAAEMVACRYRNVLYHGIKKERVDVIVYRERGFKEPWFLLVPPDSEDLLPTELVIDWYRTRMRIEVSFRDFKSWLGVRGLHLKVRRTKRFSRLLAALAIGYILLLALGSSQLGQQLRQEVEILRRRARYGTRRTLSVLSIALMVMTDSFLLSRSNLVCILASCVLSLRHGQAFLSLLPN